MNFTAKDVQGLRERTGAGMMDCKKALAECDGDVEKALDWLRQKGLSKAAKRADRATSEGVIASCVAADGKTSTIVEVMTETDFVARGDQFQAFAKAVAAEIAENAPESAVIRISALIPVTDAIASFTEARFSLSAMKFLSSESSTLRTIASPSALT